MDDLEKRFPDISELSGMPGNEAVLLGLSGGADSRALLDLLKKYSVRTGAALYAAHVNHMIRGKDAERDRDFCLKLADDYGIKCFVLECDVPALAAKNMTGLEETARKVRYDFFGSLMRERGIRVLCTAHNADDNLETVLFNLSRGCGLNGLCGIPERHEFANGVLLRPLLEITKEEILRYCERNGLEYVNDATNNDVSFTRNRIRHKILPELQKINPSVHAAVTRLTKALDADLDYLESAADGYFRENGAEANAVKTLKKLHPALLSRVLNRLYRAYSDKNTLEAVHLRDLSELAGRGVGNSSLSLPGLVRAQIRNGHLVFLKDPRKKG